MLALKKAVRSALFYVPPFYEALTSQVRYRLYYRLGLVHERDFRALPLLTSRKDPLVLDIGGNNGQSVLSIKRVLPRARIITFEPNPGHASALDRLARRFGDVTVMRMGLGESECEAELYWPVYNGKPMTALASFDRDSARGWLSSQTVYGFDERKLRIEHMRVPVRTLDSFGLEPDIIKIDVEGFEAAVLAGGMKTIERCRPAIMAEGVREGDQAFSLVAPLGYTTWAFNGKLTPNAPGQNALLLPGAGRA